MAFLRKVLTIISLTAIIAVLMSLAGCGGSSSEGSNNSGNSGANNGNNNGSGNGSGGSMSFTHEAPTVSVDVAVKEVTLKWSCNYRPFPVDYLVEMSTTSPTEGFVKAADSTTDQFGGSNAKITCQVPGKRYFRVKAIGDHVNTFDSAYSEVVEVTIEPVVEDVCSREYLQYQGRKAVCPTTYKGPTQATIRFKVGTSKECILLVTDDSDHDAWLAFSTPDRIVFTPNSLTFEVSQAFNMVNYTCSM